MSANYGPITKMGNRRLRRILVEASWAYRRSPHVSRVLQRRSAGVAKGPRDIAWSAQRRLHGKLKSMAARGKQNRVALIAVARELAGFIWAIGQEEVLVQPNA
jgi:transposase